MNEKNYAVLIGINSYSDQSFASLRYAEKDCEDISQTLTDQRIGCFLPGNVVKLVGAEANIENVQEALFTHVVHNRSADDIVLVYYSGHGFLLPEYEAAYLATSDVSIPNLIKNPMKGLSMELLHDQIFRKSRARNVILLIDACYSGSIIPTNVKGPSSDPLIDERFYATGYGKIAIVSCPPDAQSRELVQLENGIFTYWLNKGLRGEAVEQQSGEVTVDSLLAYVRKHTPADQPPGRYGQDFGRIVLSRPGIVLKADSPNKTYHSGPQHMQRDTPRIHFDALANPLEPFEPLIRKLVDLTMNDAAMSNKDSETMILDAVCQVSNAAFAFLIRGDDSGWAVRAISHLEAKGAGLSEYVDQVMSAILPLLSRKDLSDVTTGGLFGIDSDDRDLQSIAVIPLRSDSPYEFLVINGLPKEPTLSSIIFAQILRAAYFATQGFISVQPQLLEGAILDHLKGLYRFVPLAFYQRRYDVFTARLKQMTLHFQPVLRLSRVEPHIAGFEALARDPSNMKAPSDLFAAAELWGRRFSLELDLHFITTATTQYRTILSQTPGRRRPEDILDLSVNVYPESLLRTRYFEALTDIIRNEVIPSNRLFLEISEKAPLPRVDVDDGIALAIKASSFREILEKYVADLQIGFAIDDFGAGYSSLARLAELHPSYIKVDRALLQQDSASNALEFIVAFVTNVTSKKYLQSARIVVEGYDIATQSRMPLHQIYDIGIRYLQGYIAGEAKADLFRVTPELKAYLIDLMRSADIHSSE